MGRCSSKAEEVVYQMVTDNSWVASLLVILVISLYFSALLQLFAVNRLQWERNQFVVVILKFHDFQRSPNTWAGQMFQRVNNSVFLVLSVSILQIWWLFHRARFYQPLPPGVSFLCLPHFSKHLHGVKFLWENFSVYKSSLLLSISSVLGPVAA